MEEKGLKLYATRCSLYCNMVEMALKLKGLNYDYVEEDLSNKSSDLLRYNPIHEKVPVFVHDGHPILESLLILRYIDETWPSPPLLPTSPLLRSRVLFWVDYFIRKMIPASTTVLISPREKMAGVMEVLRETVKTMEDGLESDFSGDGPFFGGSAPGLLDVVFAPSCVGAPVTSQLLGTDFVNAESSPFLASRLAAIAQLEAARAVLPSHEIYTEYVTATRERFLPASQP